MSVQRGPTERRRSEGIPTKEEPSQEPDPWLPLATKRGGFSSNPPKAEQFGREDKPNHQRHPQIAELHTIKAGLVEAAFGRMRRIRDLNGD